MALWLLGDAGTVVHSGFRRKKSLGHAAVRRRVWFWSVLVVDHRTPRPGRPVRRRAGVRDRRHTASGPAGPGSLHIWRRWRLARAGRSSDDDSVCETGKSALRELPAMGIF